MRKVNAVAAEGGRTNGFDLLEASTVTALAIVDAF